MNPQDWHYANPIEFMRVVALDQVVDPATHYGLGTPVAALELRLRPEVASRRWWVMRWVDSEGNHREAEGSNVAILMERVAQCVADQRPDDGLKDR